MIQSNLTLGANDSGMAAVPIVNVPVVPTSAQPTETAKPQAPVKKSVTVSMLTPWKQECGNAEYAERLCVALNKFAEIHPFDLRNFANDFDLRSKSHVKQYFDDLVKRINDDSSSIVHIQHEFCFFGRSIQRSNREFLKFVQRIKKPIVVTLHTWLDENGKKAKKRRSIKGIFENTLEWFRTALQRKCFYRSLVRCDSIVVHTHDTFTMLVAAYPRLRKKVSIVQIPIAPVESDGSQPPFIKEKGAVWILLPGFVNPYKGHRKAINALELLPENYKLVIAGGRHPKDRGATRYWMELLEEIEERNLQSRVIFTGFLQTGSEQATVLRQADLFLLPYEEVGQSGSAVLADSLAYDRPVVTSRARSMFAYRMSQDTVFSSTSLDVNEAESLAECIVETLKNGNEKNLSADHRKAAIVRYSLDNIGSAYERLYADLRSKTGC